MGTDPIMLSWAQGWSLRLESHSIDILRESPAWNKNILRDLLLKRNSVPFHPGSILTNHGKQNNNIRRNLLLKRRSLTLHPGHHHERLQKPEGDSKDILKDLLVCSNTMNIWDWGLLGLGSDPKEEPDPEEELGSDPEVEPSWRGA